MPAVMVSSAGGGGGGGPPRDDKITVYVIVCGILSAFGGLMFGYDIGISGGVTGMDDFLEKFFPVVYVRKHHVHEDNYCKYDNKGLQLFTSSLYLAAIVASFVASKVCKRWGRKRAMQFGSFFFMAGTALCAGAEALWMLIVGRLLLGFGVGFGNQAVPLFLSEIAPAKIRGGLNICFQLMITIGILIANLVNYWASNIHPWGWRLSLGLAAGPAAALCLGSIIISETPTSLIERGKNAVGRSTLERIRGTTDVDAEYDELVRAAQVASQVQQPMRKLMKRSSRPPLVITIMLQIFQQFCGINAVMFYAPILFQTIGFKNDASLLSSVIMGSVNTACTLVSNFCVDRVGRRGLLLQACVQTIIAQTAIGSILALHLKSTNLLDHGLAIWVVLLVCLFVAGFAWSWGPLGWLIPSEIFPMETRSAGFFFAVSTNMLCTFIIAQSVLSMLCTMRAGIFFFFSAVIAVMFGFVLFLLPETKGVPIEEVNERVWKKHWYWKRYMDGDDDDNNGVELPSKL